MLDHTIADYELLSEQLPTVSLVKTAATSLIQSSAKGANTDYVNRACGWLVSEILASTGLVDAREIPAVKPSQGRNLNQSLFLGAVAAVGSVSAREFVWQAYTDIYFVDSHQRARQSCYPMY